MRRFHLAEVAELAWCPRAIRDGLTDYLRWAVHAGDVYAAVAPRLADMLRASESREIVDVGAGGGGPWERLLPRLGEAGVNVRVRLTDRSPNLRAFAQLELSSRGRVRGDQRSIDVRAIPIDLTGARVMFSVFHHCTPDEARAVLGDAARRGIPIALFEATRRDVRALAFTLLVPLVVWIATPTIRPFRWSRLLLTYLIPVIPLVACWDGLVSCLRTYTVDELREMVHGLSTPPNWCWQIEELATRGGIPVTMMAGFTPTGVDRGDSG